MKNFLKFLLAVFLLPFVFWITVETVLACWNVFRNFQNAVEFLAGIGVYCVIHWKLYRFERMYVFGHEITHAVVAMLFGFRVHDMHVGKNGGHVKMDRSNSVVALAPYCIAFYVLLVGLIYVAMSLFYPVEKARIVFVFLTGFFMAFHFVQTIQTLWETKQPDLKMAGGTVFSIIMILLSNALMLTLVLKCLFPEDVNLLKMARESINGTYHLWQFVINYIISLFSSLQNG